MNEKSDMAFYSILSPNSATLNTLNGFFDHIFPVTLKENENLNFKVTTQFIMETAYGIQHLDNYNHADVHELIVSKIEQLKKFDYLNHSNVILACDLLLKHFMDESQIFYSDHSKTDLPKHMDSVENTNIITITNQFKSIPNHKKTDRKKMISVLADTIAYDINLMNSIAFLNLQIPLNPKDSLTSNFNDLVKVISDDLSLSKGSEYNLKLKTYIQTANKLVSLNDYHGAGILSMVFSLREAEISKLDLFKEDLALLNKLYSPIGNYSFLRQCVKKNPGVPFFPIPCKDLEFTIYNNTLVDKIAVNGKIYFELSQQMTAVKHQNIPTNPKYKTNLPLWMLQKNDVVESPPSLKTMNSIEPKLNIFTESASGEKKERNDKSPEKTKAFLRSSKRFKDESTGSKMNRSRSCTITEMPESKDSFIKESKSSKERRRSSPPINTSSDADKSESKEYVKNTKNERSQKDKRLSLQFNSPRFFSNMKFSHDGKNPDEILSARERKSSEENLSL